MRGYQGGSGTATQLEKILMNFISGEKVLLSIGKKKTYNSGNELSDRSWRGHAACDRSPRTFGAF